ncbi:RNA-dependent RNA polymerase [Botryosphaeria dothidea mitovirus 2]|nr:RNA-dependent RNA polymerase [Botryosphaeria dothidea mitovirus 2]
MNRKMYAIVLKLCTLLYPNLNVKVYLNPYFKLLSRLIKTQGTIKATKFLKQGRLHCTRYLCGQPLLFNKMKLGLEPDGWPVSLSFLKPLVNGSLEERKFLMTILTLTRTLTLDNKEKKMLKPDYESITRPGRIVKTIPTGFITKFVEEFSLQDQQPVFETKNIYLSNKAGPVGKATLTALSTICSYPYELIQSLYKITSESGIKYFDDSYNFQWSKDWKSEPLGKLSFIYDPECKLRIVAIVDYYTQLFLKPIHEKIMKKLQNFPQDRTYSQDPFNKWAEDQNRYWSIDLSSATDRFPISLQRRLITLMFNKDLADGWNYILSNRKFKTPEGDWLSYSVGQPMGSYSSWAAFTITHHLVVHWCAHLCGYNKFKDYILLGDDIVIKNDEVAKKYKQWMSYLGVDLSDSKTHVSVDTYEFAKRWICKGKEITGIPMSGIVNNINNPFIVMVNLYDFYKVKKNYLSSSLNLTQIVSKLYRGLSLKLSKKFDNSKFRMKVDTFHKSLDYSFGFCTYDSLRELLCKNLKNELVMIPNNDLIHQVFDDVIGMGFGKAVKNSMTSLNQLADKIMENKNVLNEDDPNNLRLYPIFTGIVNYINNYKDSVSKWTVDSATYRQRSKELLMLNIDSVFSKERNKTLELLNTGKIFSLGFSKLNSIDEIIYGSSIGESDYSYSKDLTNMISNNYSITFNKLRDLEQGTYKEPVKQTPASMEDAWAKFFS